MIEKMGAKIEKPKEYTSKIELDFFRHGEKEQDKSKSDLEIRLTDEGKKRIVEEEKKDKSERFLDQSIAFGSPRKRTQETAGLKMAGHREEITGDESLEELEEKINQELKVGSKIGIDKRLDFSTGEKKEFNEKLFNSFKSGNFLKFVVEESDDVAKKFNDKKGMTYSRATSNIAEIMLKNLKIAPKWDRLVNDEEKEYTDVLRRYLGTHQGIGESFLAKVIEERRGIEERDKFVEILNNQGFDFAEGFKVEILSVENKEPTIRVFYKKERDGKVIFEIDEEVDKEFLNNLIIEDE